MAVSEITFESLCERPPDEELPPLDREEVGQDVVLNEETLFWRENGYLMLPNFIPHELLEAYTQACLEEGVAPHGWPEPCPFTHQPSMRDIACYRPLFDKIEMLIGSPMGLNLALTGWKSTSRTWHQDDYLNPPNVNSHYAAVWTALEDADPDSGLFEYVPGSHKWPLMRGAKVQAVLPSDKLDGNWPLEAEKLVTGLFDKKIEETGLSIETFHAKKGDVLIWHGQLAHRGSIPKNQDLERRSLITHYSSIVKRTDLPRLKRHRNEGWYFLLENSVVR